MYVHGYVFTHHLYFYFFTEASSADTRSNDPVIASSSNLTETSSSGDENVPSSSKQLKKTPDREEQPVNKETMLTEDSEGDRQESDTASLNEGESIEMVRNYNEEEHQNEQHIENAGIDPNYPLVLVQRVSLPSPGDNIREHELAEENNEDPIAMDQESANPDDVIVLEGRSVSDAIAIFNSISAAGSDNDDEDEEDDDEYVDDVWSEEDEDETAFLQNPNFRGFANQFEAIRNMIAHTRRSMAEAEANFGPVPRNSLMQRFRRILFILNNRRRRIIRLGLAAPHVELPEAEANVEMEGTNDGTENGDADARDSTVTDETNNVSIEQESEMNENAVHFDTNLPAQHSYMGGNMNRVSGVNYLEADQYVKLRLFMHQQIFFPGEVLPFMVDSSINNIEDDSDEQNGILFGVCFPYLNIKMPANGDPNGTETYEPEEYLYGVTCQIYELGGDSRNNTMVKSRALQRFATKASDLTA